MRKPTNKECQVLANTLDGLMGDISALELARKGGLEKWLRENEVSYSSLLGTFETNITVLQNIHKRLRDEAEGT